jgi:outer membrane protein assembly factor BamB
VAVAAVAIAAVAVARGATIDAAGAVPGALAQIGSMFAVISRMLGAQGGPDRSASMMGAASAGASDEWPTFNGDASRSGINPREHTIDAASVGRLKLLWSNRLPGPIDSSPVYRDRRLYLTLTNGTTAAVDANTGRALWTARTTGPHYTTSTPVLDPDDPWVYSYGLDGYVHRYALDTGGEDTSGAWPVQVTTMPDDEKGSSALNLADGRLYAVTSGYPGDGGHYQGHLVTVDLATGQTTVFNTLCSNIRALLVGQQRSANYCAAVQSGVWARAGTVVDPATNRLFIVTGNAIWDGATNWGDSVLALSLDGVTLLDSYTPTDQELLKNNDADLGASAPVLLPDQPGSLTPPLAVQAGKDGKLRLLNRLDMSGRGRPGQVGGELQVIDAPKACPVRSTPVAWSAPDGTTWLFVTTECAFGAYTLATDASGQSRLVAHWQDVTGGSSPVLANGVLYVALGQAVQARDPQTGRMLWSSDQSRMPMAPTHWNSPIVVDGRVYVGDNNGVLYAFGLS